MHRDLLRSVLDLVGAPPPPGVVIVTAGVEGGKTTAVVGLARDLAAHGVRPGGIVAPRVMQSDATIGYDVIDLSTGRSVPLARLSPPGVPAGRFYLAPEGLRFAREAIERGVAEADAVCVDEVGPAELSGGGHAEALATLLSSTKPAVLVVRDRLVATAIDVLGLADPVVVTVRASASASQTQHIHRLR